MSKIFVFLLFASFSPVLAFSQATFVNAESWDCPSGGCAAHTLSITVTAGDFVLVHCGSTGDCSGTAPTSSPTTSWTCDDTGTTSSYCYTCNAPAITTITGQESGGAAFSEVEISHNITSSCKDVSHNGTTANSTTYTSANTITTNANDGLVAMVASRTCSANTGFSATSPFTVGSSARDTISGSGCSGTSYLMVTSTGTYAATGNQFTSNSSGFVSIFSVKCNAAASGKCSNLISLLGVGCQ